MRTPSITWLAFSRFGISLPCVLAMADVFLTFYENNIPIFPRWAFLCVDGGILAWEQGMLSAERTGGAVSADQSCLRFDHPSMAAELATMEALEGETGKGVELLYSPKV